MTWIRSLTLLVLVSGITAATTLAQDELVEPAPAEASDVPTVTLTDKWSILVNPAKPRPGIIEFTEKSPIQNVDEFTFVGPMVGHPFGLGDFAEDGRWATVQGAAQPVEGKSALMHLEAADQFELEGIIHQEKLGGWLMLIGWNQGHGYSLSNVTLKDSGSPWFLCEYRGGEAIVPTNNEVKQFEWKGDQPFRMTVKEQQLSVTVGKTAILEDCPLENYTAGDVFLGTYDTRYGPRPVTVRSLRIRALGEQPEKPEKSSKKPAKAKPEKPANKPGNPLGQ